MRRGLFMPGRMARTIASTVCSLCFSHEPAISEAEAQLAWVEPSQAVMVAVDPAGAIT
jgi:hypothetical protein